jgi:hypothetical protein
MTDTPMGRDLVPPVPPADEPEIPDGLVLGIDLEELYFFVGEGQRTLYVGLGLGTDIRALDANKLDRIRTVFWSLPDGAHLVRQIDDIVDQMSTSVAAPTNVDRVAEETLRLEREETLRLERLLDGLMATVRQALPDDATYWYDLGVFLARLHMCLMILESPPTGFLRQSHETYLRELCRVIPEFAHAFVRLMRRSSTSSAPARLVRSLVVLARNLADFNDSMPGWYRIAREHADEVFTAIGMTHSGTNPLLVIARMIDDHQDETPAQVPAAGVLDPAVELGRQQTRDREMLFSHEPGAAEEGLRSLLVTVRRTLGPRHSLVFMIQSDLSMALLALGRIPLCTELALDAADEAAFHLGDHHPITAMVAHCALRMLISTGRTEEAVVFFHSRLAWLLAAEPEDLSEDLRIVRDVLLTIVTTDESGASI